MRGTGASRYPRLSGDLCAVRVNWRDELPWDGVATFDSDAVSAQMVFDMRDSFAAREAGCEPRRTS